MHHHQPNSGGVEQIEIVRKHRELAVGNDLTAEGDDKGLAAERMEIRRGGAEPGNNARVDGIGHGERF